MAEKLVANLKEVFEQKMQLLLKEVNPRLNGNWLTITKTAPVTTLLDLKADLLELAEDSIGVRVKFTLRKLNVRNAQNRYEITDIPEPIHIEHILTPDNFQVDRKINWKDLAGVDREAVVNNFQISVFRGFVTAEDLVIETFEIVE